MRKINYRGEEAVLVQEMVVGSSIFLTFVMRTPFYLNIIRMDYDGLFNIFNVKEFRITHSEMDAVQAFRMNQIDGEEFAERIQLAQ